MNHFFFHRTFSIATTVEQCFFLFSRKLSAYLRCSMTVSDALESNSVVVDLPRIQQRGKTFSNRSLLHVLHQEPAELID